MGTVSSWREECLPLDSRQFRKQWRRRSLLLVPVVEVPDTLVESVQPCVRVVKAP